MTLNPCSTSAIVKQIKNKNRVFLKTNLKYTKKWRETHSVTPSTIKRFTFGCSTIVLYNT